MKALDLEAVQAFVLVADLKSFTRAAEAMDTTQSAVSLKIKRLEEGLGRRLLERTPRMVRLSAQGGQFLERARALVSAHRMALGSFDAIPRRLVIGISQHAVGAELPMLLKQMNRLDPELVLEMRVATSREILDELDQGALDAAIVLQHDSERRDGELILTDSFGWMASPDFEYRAGDRLRLAIQADPCRVRNMALSALEAAGIPRTEIFIGGVATIGAAISAGLALAALARRVAPLGTIDIGPRLNLPPLPSRDVMLYSNVADREARESLRMLAAAIRSTAL